MADGRADAKGVEAYIAEFPVEVRRVLERIRDVVRKAAPDAVERISYRMPSYWQGGMVLFFAAFKEHIGIYPPVKGNASLMKTVTKYAGPKGNLRLPLDQGIPHGLIGRIVRQRVKQNVAKAAMKGSGKKKTSTVTRAERGHRAMAVWAAACAEHVLGYFEKKLPKDDRPRNAIAAAHAFAREEMRAGPAREAALAAHAAARKAGEGTAAQFAARAAGHAAGTAHMAGHAEHAAAYAIKAVAAAGGNEEKERAWQRRQLPTRLRAAAGF